MTPPLSLHSRQATASSDKQLPQPDEVLHVLAQTQADKQTLIRVKLETGRKHQIRAQLAHIGHPIVGDIKYGAPQRFKLKDIALHAYRLSFVDQGQGSKSKGQKLCFSCRPPSSWAARFGPEVAEIADRLASVDGEGEGLLPGAGGTDGFLV
jgi:23S rRNA-/tRNA-specific pseudouridylate synthase